MQAIEALLCRNGYSAICLANFLARADQWVVMEHLPLNLAAGRTEDWSIHRTSYAHLSVLIRSAV